MTDWDEWARQQWTERPPAAIVPRPAAGTGDLRGKRVIIGLPGVGWRGDLRADAIVVQASRTFVPVLPEQEWYRAEFEQLEVFAPLVPIERVWREMVDASAEVPTPEAALLVSLDAPPRRDPVAVRSAGHITGRRVVWMTDDGERRDLRAVTEPYTNEGGDVCARVTPELGWYQWAWSGKPPTTMEVPVAVLWAE